MGKETLDLRKMLHVEEYRGDYHYRGMDLIITLTKINEGFQGNIYRKGGEEIVAAYGARSWEDLEERVMEDLDKEIDLDEKRRAASRTADNSWKQFMEATELLNRSVDTLHLTIRAKSILEMLEVEYIGDLVALKAKDLRYVGRDGPRAVKEVSRELGKINLGLGMDVGWWVRPTQVVRQRRPRS